MKKDKLFIVGSKSVALEIETAASTDYDFEVFLVDKNCSDNKKIISEFELNKYFDDHSYLIFGIADLMIRNIVAKSFSDLKVRKTNIVSKSAFVAPDVELSAGIYVAANASISNNVRIGHDCMVSFNSVIGHDAKIGNNVVINPGAVIAGNVTIGDNCLIGGILLFIRVW